MKYIRKEFEERIKDVIDKEGYIVQARLQKFNNERLKAILQQGVYRSERHRNGLPVRGQRTHTNAKTAKKLIRRDIA